MSTPRAHIAAMASYPLATLSTPPGVRMISLSQNESLRPPAPSVAQAISASLDALQLYPDPDWSSVKQSLSQLHGLPEAQLLCGAGSMELIACLAHCWLQRGSSVVGSQYGYAFLSTAAQFTDAELILAAEACYTVSVDQLLNTVRPDTTMVFIANPGNPTGTRISASEIHRLRDALPASVLLVIDEAYGEFADHLNESLFELPSHSNTVILRTLSKAYGLAGMRVGWGVFPCHIGAEVRKLLNPNNISVTSQAAASAALQDQHYLRETCTLTATIRQSAIARLRQLGVRIPDSYSNFFLADFGTAERASTLFEALRAQGVVARTMGGYGLPQCLRFTVANAADMTFACDILDHELTA